VVPRGAQEARPAEAEAAFARADALPSRPGAGRAREVALRAHMYQCMGEHARGVALITKALASGLGPAPIECLFLRGAARGRPRARSSAPGWPPARCVLFRAGLMGGAGSAAPAARRRRHPARPAAWRRAACCAAPSSAGRGRRGERAARAQAPASTRSGTTAPRRRTTRRPWPPSATVRATTRAASSWPRSTSASWRSTATAASMPPSPASAPITTCTPSSRRAAAPRRLFAPRPQTVAARAARSRRQRARQSRERAAAAARGARPAHRMHARGSARATAAPAEAPGRTGGGRAWAVANMSAVRTALGRASLAAMAPAAMVRAADGLCVQRARAESALLGVSGRDGADAGVRTSQSRSAGRARRSPGGAAGGAAARADARRARAQELWCKKGAPTAELLAAIRLEAPLPVTPALPPPRPPAALLARLTGPADAVGRLLQYRHQGFMANRRQQRMGGLAALELAQALRHLVRPRPARSPRSSAAAPARPGPTRQCSGRARRTCHLCAGAVLEPTLLAHGTGSVRHNFLVARPSRPAAHRRTESGVCEVRDSVPWAGRVGLSRASRVGRLPASRVGLSRVRVDL